ncbi:YpsA SLOG family protein [Demequina sp. NBRC 110057]|uniref:YpsA SLOG family protein n=1 Tax=Demequina sp. NBRC 110057 TaxID=1570346 RepID=UPI0009FF688D|nr:putative molybdenum carrier protein [Demequina sp. NBRC 110057]
MRGGTRADEVTGTGGVIARIIAGGQTGVDRGALDAAIAMKVVHGGWCPAGGIAEDKPYAPGVLIDYPGLKPTMSADPEIRTRLNVRDSHATLVLGDPEVSEGAARAVGTAAELSRPCLVSPATPDEAFAWLSGLGRELLINVAGPRESQWPGARDASYAFVTALLERDRR